jgi:hypothetical protein
MKLSKFVTTFTDEAPNPDDEKCVFPYEFIQSNNYMEILSKTDPFPQHAFNNYKWAIIILIEKKENSLIGGYSEEEEDEGEEELKEVDEGCNCEELK